MALGDPRSPPPSPGLPSDNISQPKTCSPHHPALLCWVPCTASLTVSSTVVGGVWLWFYTFLPSKGFRVKPKRWLGAVVWWGGMPGPVPSTPGYKLLPDSTFFWGWGRGGRGRTVVSTGCPPCPPALWGSPPSHCSSPFPLHPGLGGCQPWESHWAAGECPLSPRGGAWS